MKMKESKIDLKNWFCNKTIKAVKHEGDGNTNNSWHKGSSHYGLGKATGWTGNQEKKIETIKITVFLRSARILRRVIETWWDKLTQKLVRSTIRQLQLLLLLIKTMKHESDRETNCKWCARNSHQRTGKRKSKTWK